MQVYGQIEGDHKGEHASVKSVSFVDVRFDDKCVRGTEGFEVGRNVAGLAFRCTEETHGDRRRMQQGTGQPPPLGDQPLSCAVPFVSMRSPLSCGAAGAQERVRAVRRRAVQSIGLSQSWSGAAR